MASVLNHPNYSIDYPSASDGLILNTTSILNATALNAYQSTEGTPYDLTLGASSNISIEAVEGVNIYFDEAQSLTLFNTSYVNSTRTDSPILQVNHSNNTTYIVSSNLALDLSGTDTHRTTIVSQTTLSSSNGTQLLQTDLDCFSVQNPMYISSNLDVSYDVVSHNNIACSGNMFSSSLNLYKNYASGSNTQVAFGFFINEYDQLEIVRYQKFEMSNVITTATKRIATFGKYQGTPVGDLNNYVALNQFNGIVGTSNGSTPSFTNVLWNPQPGTSNTYYISGNVGIGTTNPTARLHVKQGDIKVEGHILPEANITYDLGSSNLRWRDLYLSGNTINLAGATISVNETGTIQMQGTNGATPIDVSALESNIALAMLMSESACNVAMSVTNIATSASNIAYSTGDMAIFGSNTSVSATNKLNTLSNYTTSNINSIIASATSTKNTTLWSSNILLKNTGGNMTGTLTTTYLGVNTTSPAERIDVEGNVRVSSNLYAWSSISVGTSNPTSPLHVVGNARIDGNLDVRGIFNTVNTDVQVTDQFTVSNDGTGPALKVYQMGAQAIADFYDDSNIAVRIADGGSVGIGTLYPAYKLDVNGAIYSTSIQGPTISAMSNLGMFASNVAVGASNKSYTLSNYVYGSNTPTILTTQTTANWSSNTSVYGSNTSYSASNNAFTLSNYVYGSNTNNISAAQNTANWASNAASTSTLSNYVYGSNTNNISTAQTTANWASNAAATSASSTLSNYVYGSITTNISSLQTSTTWSSNTAVLGSNISVGASNKSYMLSNYVYGSNTTAIVTAQTTANWSSNAGLFGSNTSGFASNNTITLSNYVYGSNTTGILTAQTTANWSSNTGVYGSNTSFTLSNYVYGSNTSAILSAQITANFSSNAGLYASNTSGFASNNTITLSNYVYGSNTFNILSAQTAANWSSNAGLFGSNNSLALSNYVYGSNTTTILSAQATANWSSNTGVYSSNTSGFASNNTITLSNYVYGSNTTAILSAQITANWSSNAGLFGSNHSFSLSNYVYGSNVSNITWSSNVAVFGSNVSVASSNTAFWSSNNLVKKTGGDISGTLTVASLGVNNINPSEKIDVVGNVKVSSNLYVGTSIGIGTNNPSQPLHIIGNARIEGNLDVNGIFNTINTDVQVTDQFTVSNNGTGPAMKVYQMGAQPIADFYDDSNIAVRIADGGLVGIGTSNPAYKLDVNGVINSTSIQGPTITALSNASIFGSNTSVSSSNSIVTLSNYTYGTNTTNISTAQITANFGSNASIFGSNTSVSASNVSISLSNYVYGNNTTNITAAQTTANFASNIAVGDSNKSYTLSNYVYGTNTTNISTAQTIANFGSNASVFGSNTSVSTSNSIVTLSNYTYGTNTSNATNILTAQTTANFSSNASVFGSNISVSTSNLIVALSNYTYVSNTTNISTAQTTANFGSNASVFSSNTSVSVSNVSISLSNYVYGTNTTNISTAQTTALWSSNVALYGSNTAYWSSNTAIPWTSNTALFGSNTAYWLSNNHVNKAGDTMTGTLTMNTPSSFSVITFANNITGNVNLGLAYAATQFSTDANSNDFVVRTVPVAGRIMMQNGSGSSALTINSNNTVGIGTSTPAYKLDVVGTINSTDAISGPTITLLSNLGLYGSNTAYWTSNTAIPWTSNASIFGSNTSVSASNVSISLSNYVYGTNTTNITAVQTTAIWSSNAALYGSNTAYWTSNTAIPWTSNTSCWSSNNLVNKSGDNMTGTLTTTMLGISTTTPTEKVDVVGNVKVSSNIYVGNSIGIGTSNPSQLLHVVGNARIEGNLDVNGIFNTINTDVQVTDQFTVSNNGTGPAMKVYQMGAQPIADFYDDSNIAMRVADGGSVGIGNSNPLYKLDVTGELASKLQMRIRNSNYSLIMRNDNSVSYLMLTANNDPDGTWNSFRPMQIGNSTGTVILATNALTALNNGSVGINNTTPTYKLDVNGTIRTTSNLTMSNYGKVDIYSSNNCLGIGTSNPAYLLDVNGQVRTTGITPLNASTINLNDVYGLQPTSNLLNVMISSSSNYVYNPGSAGGSNNFAKYMAIKAGDMVGSYWGGNPTITGADIVLQAGNINLTGNNGSATVYGYGGNLKFQPGFAYVSGTSGGNNRTVKSGETIFYYANTNGISVDSNLTEAMRIGATGNVGIGLSNPAYKLDVSGVINSTSIQGPTITALSNLGLYGSNTAYWSSNNLFSSYGGVVSGNLDVTGSIRLGNSNSEIKTLTSIMTNAVAGTAKLTFASGGGPLNAKVIVQVCRPASGSESTMFEEFNVSWSSLLSSPLVITSVQRSLNWSLSSYQTTPSKWYYDSSTGTITLESARSIQSTGTFQMYYTIIGRTPLSTTATFDANTPPGTVVTSVGFIVNENSNVGIGTSTPAYKLDISGDVHVPDNNALMSGTTNGYLRMFGTGGVTYIQSGLSNASSSVAPLVFGTISNTTEWARFITNGNLGIGTPSPSYKLHVTGDIYATGSVAAYSDIRAKSNLDVITNPIEKILQLTGYTYDMIIPSDLSTKITPRYTGIIAQDLEKVLPEAVHQDKDGHYSVAYGNIAGLFVEAFKELTNENEQLKNRMQCLEEIVKTLVPPVKKIRKKREPKKAPTA